MQPGSRDRPLAHVLVLVRHGESVWNLANRFTGWTDVDLTPQGARQAALAGALLRAHGFTFDVAYTSVLSRAIRTLQIMKDRMGVMSLPEIYSWRLNERHYGALQGLNKAETAAMHGDEQVHIWRRSYAVQPPALDLNDPRHPRHDSRYRELNDADLPATESLKDCVARSLPFFESDIAPALLRGERVLVVAHGNSLRGIVKHLDAISDEDIMQLEIPVGAPLVYELDENLAPIRHYYLGRQLVAAPPLNVTMLPPLSLDAVSLLAAAVQGVVSDTGEIELQDLMEALVAGGATTADNVHNAATAAALAGDLAEAEDLMLRGVLAAAKYIFSYIPRSAVMEAAVAAPIILAPAGPALDSLPDVTMLGADETAYTRSGYAASWAAGTGGKSLGVFHRVAPLLNVERHVVVAMLAAASGVVPEVKVAASLAAELLAILGVEKKLVLAMPNNVIGSTEEEASTTLNALGMDLVREKLPAGWRCGGWAWGAGAASQEDVAIISDALTCASGSVWVAHSNPV